MAKQIKFTLTDLEVMKSILNDTLTQMREDLATNQEKCSVIIPLVKIDQLIAKQIEQLIKKAVK
jgi:hypothetical protein